MPKNEKLALWGLIIAYIIFFGVFTSVRHYDFQTQTWDMGVFVQTFWNTIHGRIMANHIEEAPNHLGVHMSPFLFLLVPFFALIPSPYTLLWLQTIFLALGALPLYFLAKSILPPSTVAKRLPLILAAGYLLYPSLHWVNFFDFHEIAFFPALFLAAFYFIQKENWRWAAVFLALAASTKEDAIIAVLFAGLYLLVKKNPAAKKFGLAVALLAAVYFLVATKIIMPALGGKLFRLDRYSNLGPTPAAIIKNIFLRPQLLLKTVFIGFKIRYVFWLFLPVAFLPFFSGSAFLLLIPGLLENLLTNFQLQFTGLYQYDAMLIPGIFIAAAYGLRNLLDRYPKIKWLPGGLIAAMLAGYLFISPANPISFPVALFQSNRQWEIFRQMVQAVPPGVSVAANTNLVPHLSDREYIFMLGHETFMTDYVLIDGSDPFGFQSMEQFQAYVDRYVKSGKYNIRSFDDRYFILSKK